MLIQNQYIRFNANLDRGGNTTIIFIVEEAKEMTLDYSQGTVKVLLIYFTII